MTNPPVVTRFAPSPTGHLHIGGARTALFCKAFADRHDGVFLLRIEDTDQLRSSQASTDGILEDLRWLGIDWDEGPDFEGIGGDPRSVGPFSQSERGSIYSTYFDQLIEKGLAYPAFETNEELTARRAEAEANKQTFVYRKPADYDHAAAMERMKAEDHVLRLVAPSEAIVVEDAVLGTVTIQPEDLEDFIIRKKDGFPTYHFAVVVDDELMGVTHVLRGQEHLNNAPKHVAIQQALGFRIPAYAHMPLIFNPDGSKMSKRDKDKTAKAAVRKAGHQTLEALRAAIHATDSASPLGSLDGADFDTWLSDKTRQLPSDVLTELADGLGVELPEIEVEDFRRAGFLPEVVCNAIALLGWNPGMKNEDGTDLDRFEYPFLAEHFGLERIGKSAAKFDRDKLLAFNFDTIQSMEPSVLASRWRTWAERHDPSLVASLGDRFELAAGAARQRAKTLKELRTPIGFALMADDAVTYDEKAVKKVLLKNDGEGLGMLAKLSAVIEGIEPFEPVAIEAGIKDWAESNEFGMGKVAQPLRVALTGTSASPGLGETLALVGKPGVLARISRCLSSHEEATAE